MNIQNLKLKCVIAQRTDLIFPVIYEKIILELEKNEYKIVEQSNNHVLFDNSISSSHEIRGASSAKLEMGFFELYQSNQNILKLTYFVSYKFVLFSILAVVLISYFLDVVFLVLGGFLLITFVIQFFVQRSTAKDLLNKIVNTSITLKNIDE